MAGKKQQSGVKTSLVPEHETFTVFRAQLLHGHREWRMIRLRALITECRHFTDQLQKSSKDGWTAADERRAQDHFNERAAEINALWRDLSAQFERAALAGNADWFERQAKAIRSGDNRSNTDKAHDRFEAAVARELEFAYWETRVEQQKCSGARGKLQSGETRHYADRNKGKDAAQQAEKQRTAVKR